METESSAVEIFCRLCLKPNTQYLALFENKLVEMLESLTSIKISCDDAALNLTCLKCFIEMNCAYQIQQRLIKTEKALQTRILNKVVVKEEIQISFNELEAAEIAVKCEDTESVEIKPEKHNFEQIVSGKNTNQVVCKDKTYSMSNTNQTVCRDEIKSAYQTQQQLTEAEKLLEAKILSQVVVKEKSISELPPSESAPECENSETVEIKIEENFEEIDRKDRTNEAVYRDEECSNKYKNTLDCNEDVQDSLTGTKPCLMCPKLVLWAELKQHIRTHDSGYCEYCGTQQKNSRSLRKHVRLSHTEPKIMCERCGDVSDNQKDFELHIRRIHTNDPLFVCDYCGAKLFRFGDFKNHMKQKHSNEKPFSCSVCNRTFALKKKLKIHQLRHSNETFFDCEFCGKGFKVKNNMNTHKKNIHGWKSEEKYRCNLCSKGFPTKRSLSVHLARGHNK